MSEKLRSTRDGFGDAMVALGQSNPQVLALSADLTESVRLADFANRFPERFIRVGVAEQALAGIAAGLALVGKIPVAASYAAFQPANSWGVIRTSIALQNLNVKLIGGHAGLATGADGATHQALEDIALMRVLPNMVVLQPADYQEAYDVTLAAVAHVGPVYLRTSKAEVPDLDFNESFKIGKIRTLQTGSDLTIIGSGAVFSEIFLAVEQLEKRGLGITVLNLSSIKPIDREALFAAATQTGGIITIEDHQVAGGMGSAVCEVISGIGVATRCIRLGAQDTFGESGTNTELYQRYGLSAKAILSAANSILAKG